MENTKSKASTDPIFRNLTADDPDPETTEIESLCVNCGENGTTRVLLTKIPFYKEVVLMSFECEHCGFKNNEIQPGGKVDEKGIRITLTVEKEQDLNRQVVKSDYTSVRIVELDFEIPAQSQRGEVTTVEGVIDRAITGLEQDQPLRRIQDSATAEQIDGFLTKLKRLKSIESPFTVVFEDISGNSFVENPRAPQNDPRVDIVRFTRNKDQDHLLGIYSSNEIGVEPKETGLLKKIEEGDFTLEDLHGEVLQFQTPCPNCGTECSTNMKLTNIPHFKEVVIMATNCEECGHRSNEVKSSGCIEPKGIRIAVKVTSRDDFTRDVLKSETCSLEIPELDLTVGPFALGGRFTTVEGLLVAMKDQLISQGAMFVDSADAETKKRVLKFTAELDAVLEAEKDITIVLDDPAGNSYVQSFTEPEPDPGLSIIRYERTHAHNEELGLNDMKTENYETDDNR
ncbi:zinc finger protein ZPR1 [Periplaneta americana]|uniref:zinc finger protein ZPR1 n=1 Tax=Periplaneta americana TaxID=6978 RepID=UPI0037E75BD6